MSNNLLHMVQLARQGQPVPVTQLTRENPLLASIASKMIQGQDPPQHNDKGDRKITAPDENHLNQLSTNIARNIRENKSLMQMLPDLELGFQILISVCCAPKDMVTMELVLETGLRNLSPSVVGKLVQVIRDYLDNTYKIKNKIPDILRDIFQVSGSHILAVLPENSIDELINRHGSISMEDYQNIVKQPTYRTGLGLIGAGQSSQASEESISYGKAPLFTLTAAVENQAFYDIDAKAAVENKHYLTLKSATATEVFEDVVITDNPNVLRNSSLLNALRRGVVEKRLANNSIRPGLENFKIAAGATTITDKILSEMIYKPRNSTAKRMEILRTQNQLSRAPIGEPLVLNLPPEAVVPVVTPGDESRHVGYFVLLDETGNPVKGNSMVDGYGALAQRMMPGQSQNSALLNRLNSLNNGIACSNYLDMRRSVRIYADLVEQDWTASLKNGLYANGVALAKVDDIYRILLARKLQNQRSTVLFLPVESVTYFALRYNEHGVGVSLLDEMKIINSQRAVLMFANTMSGITSSMDLTDVEIKLDEGDPDPQDTVEKVMDALVRANTTMFPLGVDSPSDIVSYLAKAQYSFKTTGHPGMPEMSVDINHKQAQRGKVDTDLQEQLRKYSYASLGLTLEHVDNGFNNQTATSVVAESLMLSRRVTNIQDQFNPHLTDHVRKMIRASQPLCDTLREIIKANLDSLKIDIKAIQEKLGQHAVAADVVTERILSDFVNTLDVSLPKPNMATMTAQVKALEEYKNHISTGVDAYISSDMFSSDIVGEVSNSIEGFRKVVIAHFMRKFMADNAILPDLADLTDVDEDGVPNTNLFEQITDHVQRLMRTSGNLLKKINKDKVESNNLLEKLAAAGDSSETATDDSGSGGAGFGDEGGDDPFGEMDDPFKEEDETPPEEEGGTDEKQKPEDENPPDENASDTEPPTV